MASKNQVAGNTKTNKKTPNKTQSSLSNQEKKDLSQKIENLKNENDRLRFENAMFKNKFDLRETIKVFSQKGVTELDGIEMAKDAVKGALEAAEKKHEVEKKDMEKKHKKEIELLRQNQQGEDQMPTQSIGDSMPSQETAEEIAKYRAEKKNLESEIVSLKTDKDELNNKIKQLTTEKESLTNQQKKTDELLSKKDNEITDLKKQLANLTTRNQDAISKNGKQDDTLLLLRKTTKEKEEAISEKNDLLAENQKLQAKIEKMQSENRDQTTSYEDEKNDLLAENQKLQAKIEKMQSENRDQTTSYEETKCTVLADKQKMDADIKGQQNEIKALKQSEEKNKSLNDKNQGTILEPVDPADIKIWMREATKEIEEANSEKKDLVEGNQKLKEEVQKLQNENKEQKQLYGKTKDLMEKEKSTLQADKQKMDTEMKKLRAEITSLKQSEEKNKSLNEKLREVEEAKDNLSQQIQEVMKENDELKYRLKESQSPPLSKVNENKAIQQLKDENEILRSRLSEYAGAQMTHNNPNIADLSDVFRPTKLSEEYSQLYDNVWTDAFEEQNGKKEEDIIQMLRKGLLGSYEFCENVCKEFTVQLTNSTLALPNSKPKNKLQDLPIVYQKQLQDMKKSFGVFLKNDVKESYRKKQNSIQGGDSTKKYIDACVELCWLMVIQDPPVVIETPASKDSAFDTNTYRAYTTTGSKIDFVVWPALRLHQGGALLTKGVAQGKN
ncbi:hypothetical protein ACJMK2_031616 [Sinanodonta woodiana]|uniref:Mitochondria-eating protein C-terminal domain-containing protein n=1 Tax=Sinanodonta woodiana TaxID=1069815 RepID=A0ABD3X0R8_SINWO